MNEALNMGLKASDITYLRDLFANISEIEKVEIFGSRAKGDFRPGSDIDLAVSGDIPAHSLLSMKYTLQYESPFPFSCDVVEYSKISPEMQAHIDRVGKVVYQK